MPVCHASFATFAAYPPWNPTRPSELHGMRATNAARRGEANVSHHRAHRTNVTHDHRAHRQADRQAFYGAASVEANLTRPHGGGHSSAHATERTCTVPRACMADAESSPLLVYHPQGGLNNCLFGLSSAALLATAQCRRFAVAWGRNTNRQAGASFERLFRRPEGLAFVNESEGSSLIAALSGTPSSGCIVQINTHWNQSRALTSLLPVGGADSDGRTLAARCPVLHVKCNLYFARELARTPRVARAAQWLRARGLGCSSAALPSDEMPYFAAVSRHLFVPHSAAIARADDASLRPASQAVIGVHVRSTILLALHKDRRVAACGSSVACPNILRAYGFLECIAKVRNASAAAGYATSRVYVGADNPMVRTEALGAFGEHDLVPTPSYLFTGHEARGKMTTMRGAVSTSGAVDEMLLLARSDALVVYDLVDSTYSAAAASWAAHRVGQTSARASRTWLGVYVASQGCTRLPDAEVDPPTHSTVLRPASAVPHT
jgi:hypothetical protein